MSTSSVDTSEKGMPYFQRFYSNVNRKQIPGLDGLRAIAVLIVIVSHFDTTIINGGLGVMMFFVLSGFLITWLLLSEDEKHGKVSLKNFYIRRTLRIFPAFYFFWFSGITIFLVRGHEIIWPEAFSAFFYFSNYYYGVPLGESIGNLFGHTWSLCVEEQFYFLWPLVFLYTRHDAKKLLFVSVGLVLILWVYRAFLVYHFETRQEYLYRAFDTRFDHLLLGCILAVCVKKNFFGKTTQFLVASPWLLLVTFCLLFGLQTFHKSYVYTFSLGYVIEPIIIAIILVQCVCFSTSGIWKIFENPVICYLGRISYPLYLWQQLTIYTSKRLADGFPIIVQLGFSIIVTVFFASVSYYVVEKYFLSLKSKWSW